MPLTLHSATIPPFLQSLGALAGIVERGAAHQVEKQLAEADLIDARLAGDMLPFGFQVKAATVHSAGALGAVRSGVFRPDTTPWPDTFAGLRQLVADTHAVVSAFPEADMEAAADQIMRFEYRDTHLDFKVGEFLLSFSLPNMYFHTATAYDILRSREVRLAKIDYLGKLRVHR